MDISTRYPRRSVPRSCRCRRRRGSTTSHRTPCASARSSTRRSRPSNQRRRMHYQIEPDVFGTYGITAEPRMPEAHTTFAAGLPIKGTVPTPLEFKSNFPKDEPPRAMAGLSIPVWSADLVQLMRRHGVDNLQTFEAKILGREPGVEWTGYFAVNVVGLVAAADMAKSKFVPMMETPSGQPVVG